MLDKDIVNSSEKLIEKYGIGGLRSLAAFQLAAACSVRDSFDFALPGVKLLNSFLLAENLLITVKIG